jgi:hypothetical protein
MQGFEQDGYAVLPGAAPQDALAAYAEQRAAARDGLLVRRPGADHVELATSVSDDQAGAVDPYAIVDAARALLLSPALTQLLTTAYDGDAPLLFDALESAAGGPDGDRAHRDATFTALAHRPETLVTLAVALGPDDATFTCRPGSHRIETTPFSGRHRAFNPERDGDAALERHHEELEAALVPETDTITLHPGDAVAWTADLVHAPIAGPALVAHLCPSGVQPAWFAYRPERARHAAAADGAAWLTTQHYDLVDAVSPEAAPAGVEDDPELERVEEALREHDEELAIEPPAPEPTGRGAGRQGGLVDSVRGLLNRRGRGR